MIRQMKICKITLNCFIVLFCFNHLNAQKVANQIWLEYRPTYNFNPKFKVDMRFSFRDEFDETNWHTWEARAIPVYKLSKRFDVNFGISFLETTQNIQLSTSEIRFAPGLRYHVPWERIELGAWARVELRSVYEKQLDEWTYTTRPRLRIFTDIPINAKSMKEENFVYASSFAEFFYQNDEDLQERYAKRYWFRLGLGYKLNQNWRFEFLYNRQDSKNTIDQSLADTSKENIFVFAVRHKIK
ncbi:MAG: DUF2490 domain-containing protein [Lutimonas sp.]